jgi:hypothetical protein
MEWGACRHGVGFSSSREYHLVRRTPTCPASLTNTFPVILWILVFLFLPSYPEECTWLTTDKKAVQQKRLGQVGSRSVTVFNALFNVRLTLKVNKKSHGWMPKQHYLTLGYMLIMLHTLAWAALLAPCLFLRRPLYWG